MFSGEIDEAGRDEHQEADEEDPLAAREHPVGAILGEAGQQLRAGGADVLLEVDLPQQAVEVGAGDHVAADPQVGELADRLVGLVVERVRDRDVQRLVVDLERDAATLALERLGDHLHRLGRRLDAVEVDERYPQLVGQRRRQVALLDQPFVVEDLADPAARLLLDRRAPPTSSSSVISSRSTRISPIRPGATTVPGGGGPLGGGGVREAGDVREVAVDAVDRRVDLVRRREHDVELVGGQREGDVLRHPVPAVGHREDERPAVVGDRQHPEVPADLLRQHLRRDRVDGIAARDRGIELQRDGRDARHRRVQVGGMGWVHVVGVHRIRVSRGRGT